MEKRLVEVKLQGKDWFYCPVNHFLYLDPQGIAGTFSLNVLTPEEKSDLRKQVDNLLQAQKMNAENI